MCIRDSLVVEQSSFQKTPHGGVIRTVVHGSIVWQLGHCIDAPTVPKGSRPTQQELLREADSATYRQTCVGPLSPFNSEEDY